MLVANQEDPDVFFDIRDKLLQVHHAAGHLQVSEDPVRHFLFPNPHDPSPLTTENGFHHHVTSQVMKCIHRLVRGLTGNCLRKGNALATEFF